MSIFNIAWGLFGPPLCSSAWWFAYRMLHWRFNFILGWLGSAAGLGSACAMAGRWTELACAGISATVAIFLWWFNRRRRDRAKAWLGAKSKALRDALVRKQRELAKPRPVLRPVPQGGGWCS